MGKLASISSWPWSSWPSISCSPLETLLVIPSIPGMIDPRKSRENTTFPQWSHHRSIVAMNYQRL